MTLKIKDLVDVQMITDIVDIEAFDEGSIVKDYVITDEIKECLANILDRIVNFQRDAKNSFLLYGGYGTGKSHFLAFLYSILTKRELYDFIDSFTLTFPQTFTVKLKATGTSVRLLEDFIFEALERAFYQKHRRDILLSGEKEYLKAFTENFKDLPKFQNFLKEKGVNDWEELLQYNTRRAVEIAKEYERETNVRVVISSPYRQKFEKFLDEIRKSEGKELSLVILLDELADYLDRSSEWGTINQNISFLQEIGEISQKTKVHLIAALQEEQWFHIKGIEEAKQRKIVDRFESWTLSNVDFKKIAGERILRKRDKNKLLSYYPEIKRRFPSIIFDEKDDKEGFSLIYPVHPFIFKAIEAMNLAGGSSRQRTALGFISEKVAEIKEKPWDTFLTIDAVFDFYFEDPEIQKKLHSFWRCYQYFEENVFPKVDEDFKDIATSLLKTMIVLRIGEFEEKTAKELADLVLLGVGEDGQVNYSIYEGLIEKELRDKGGARYIKKITKLGESAYYIDVGYDGPSASEEIERVAQSIPDTDKDIIKVFENFWSERLKEAGWFAFQEENLGLEGILKYTNVDKVEWKSKNVERSGKVYFVSELKDFLLSEFNDWFSVQPLLDFQLVLTMYPQVLSSKIRDDRLFIFEPDVISPEELFQLKKLVAAERLEKKEERKELVDEITVERKKIQEKVETILKEAYFERGKIYNTKDINLILQDYSDNLKSLIEQIIDEPLSRKYPEHPHFTRVYSRTHTNKLIKEFIARGKEEEPPKALSELIEGIMIPLNLVDRKTRGKKVQYELKKNLESTRFAGEILRWLKNVKRADIKSLWNYIRSHFGLDEHFFEVLLYSLLKRGKIILLKRGEPFKVTNIDKVIQKPERWNYFDEIALPQETDKEKIARIIEAVTTRKIDPTDDEELEIGWQEVYNLKRDYSFEGFERQIRTLPPEISHEELLEELENKARPFFSFLENVKDSLPNLFELQELEPSKLLEGRGFLLKLEDVFKSKDYFENKLRYLKGINDTEFQKERDKIIDKLRPKNLLDNLEGVRKTIDNFIKRYGDYYFNKHEKKVGNLSDFSDLERLPLCSDFKNLEKLTQLKGLSLSQSFEEVKKIYSEALVKQCLALKREELEREPLCPHCKFDPEENFSVEAKVKEIKEVIQQSLSTITKHLKERLQKAIELDKISPEVESMIKETLEKGFRDIEIDKTLLDSLSSLGVVGIKEYRFNTKEFIRQIGLDKPLSLEELRKNIDEFLASLKQDGAEEVRIIIEV
jgi:hypothetical protein